ncbi:hypothetical protein KGF56_000737 [Candida oxycetoniae]|uniref:Uncharacterized protein n=1 Tax=Candida oxycetoniae TaxID=497107 RepID=A0AAI9T1B0_9ASCO|nr:uncharacterized protein KGF56_000737 [Candida oxycetoniae]KAI3406605.2 hypothetical protein KGF56_000737 [Candida oxycetoniae]
MRNESWQKQKQQLQKQQSSSQNVISSPNYQYGTHHRRSHSIDLRPHDSEISVLSLMPSMQISTSSCSSSPKPPEQQVLNRQQARKQINVIRNPPKELVPLTPIIDLDRITEEFKKGRKELWQKEMDWYKFLKEKPVDTDIYFRNSSSSSNSSLPKSSEMLLDKYNSCYNYVGGEDDDDDVEGEKDEKDIQIGSAFTRGRLKDKLLTRALSKLKIKLV